VTATKTVTVTVTPTPTRTRVKPTPRKVVVKRTPKPVPKRTQAPRPAIRSGVHPGSFCAPQGAMGRTVKGTLMQCSSKGGDQARWRSA
jgi:hypothetical protein